MLHDGEEEEEEEEREDEDEDGVSAELRTTVRSARTGKLSCPSSRCSRRLLQFSRFPPTMRMTTTTTFHFVRRHDYTRWRERSSSSSLTPPPPPPPPPSLSRRPSIAAATAVVAAAAVAATTTTTTIALDTSRVKQGKDGIRRRYRTTVDYVHARRPGVAPRAAGAIPRTAALSNEDSAISSRSRARARVYPVFGRSETSILGRTTTDRPCCRSRDRVDRPRLR